MLATNRRPLSQGRRHGGRPGGSLLPSPRAAVARAAGGRRSALPVSRAQVCAVRQVHRDSPARPSCRGGRRARLSGSGARLLDLAMDGRPGAGRSGADPVGAGPRRFLDHAHGRAFAYEASYEFSSTTTCSISPISATFTPRHWDAAAWRGPAAGPRTHLERGLRIARWVVDNPVAPLSASLPAPVPMPGVPRLHGAGRVPAHQQVLPTRHGRRLQQGAPDDSQTPFWTSMTSQAITPISEKKSIYYFSSCIERARANDLRQADAQIDLFRRAFDEGQRHDRGATARDRSHAAARRACWRPPPMSRSTSSGSSWPP